MEWWLILIILWFLILVPRTQNKYSHYIRKKKGVKRKMPIKAVQEFLNKRCVIYLFGGHAVEGVIVEVEENWIKVQEKKKKRLINGDMIAEISCKIEN